MERIKTNHGNLTVAKELPFGFMAIQQVETKAGAAHRVVRGMQDGEVVGVGAVRPVLDCNGDHKPMKNREVRRWWKQPDGSRVVAMLHWLGVKPSYSKALRE